MFTFCPLQGALSDSTASQSLLELDGGVKVLIDVGWDETFDVEKLRELEKYFYFPTAVYSCLSLTTAFPDKFRPCRLSFLLMRRSLILLPMLTAARTSHSSREFLCMRRDQSSTSAER